MRNRFALLTYIIVLVSLSLGVLSACHESGGFINQVNTAPTLAFSLTSLPDAQVNITYNQQLIATGGVGTRTFNETTNSLSSAGLSLSTSGVISGNPTTPGNYSFTVQVHDEGVPVQSLTRTFNLRVTLNGTIPNTAPVFTALPTGAKLYHQAVTNYDFQFAATDADNDPLLFTLGDPFQPAKAPIIKLGGGTTGNPPTLNASTGAFEWSQMSIGTYEITIAVSDASNPPQIFTWRVLVTTAGGPPAPNQPPYVKNPKAAPAEQNQLVNHGMAFTHTLDGADIDGDTITWSILAANSDTLPPQPASVPPVVVGMGTNNATGVVTWEPTSSDTPGPWVIVVRAADGSGNQIDTFVKITLSAGPAVPSDLRIWVGNYTESTAASVNGAGAKIQSEIRSLEGLDPNIPAAHDLATLGPTTIDGMFFGEGSQRLALVGPKHSLRVGSLQPREVNINSVRAYIQCPQYSARNLDTTGPANIDATCRLFHYTDTEVANTGVNDFIVVLDTAGRSQVFSFGTNIHEEIFVPHNFSNAPIFVVVSEIGDQMWICRVDHRNFPNGSNMQTVNLAGTNNKPVKHTSVSMTGGMLNTTTGLISGLVWFVADGQGAGDDELYSVNFGSTGAPLAISQMLPTGGGSTPSLISSYVARSGDGTHLAIVAGNNLAVRSGIDPTMPPAGMPELDPLGKWRDMWIVNGSTAPAVIRRVTNFQSAVNQRDNGGGMLLAPMIDVFESRSAYVDSGGAAPGMSTGGFDRRTIFSEGDDRFNTRVVGHTLNYDGSIVAFVALETLAMSGDGTSSTFYFDEVYAAGTLSTTGHDVIRLTASSNIPSTPVTPGEVEGSRSNVSTRFNTNMGTCTGLTFATLGNSGGRGTRLFFGYAMAVAMTHIELCSHIYASEFTFTTNALTHGTTVDRTTGIAPPVTGFNIVDSDLNVRAYLGSGEVGGDTTGHLVFVYCTGNASNPAAPIVNPDCSLSYVDMTVPNVAVSVTLSATRLTPYENVNGDPVLVYRVNNSRTHLSSGADAIAPFGAGGATVRAHVSSLFADIPGVASLANRSSRFFVAARNAAGGEDLVAINVAQPTNSFSMANMSGMNRIHYISIAPDGSAAAIHAGPSISPTPDYRRGISQSQDRIFLVPSFDYALAENQATPSTPGFTAPQVAGIAGSAEVSLSGAWANTFPITNAQTFDYFVAWGSASGAGNYPTGQMRLKSIRTTRVTGMAPTIDAAVDMDLNTSPGAIVIYGSGRRQP